MATRTRTVVFTDLANYTASVGRSDREGLRNLIATHEKLVAPVLERFGGRIVKNLGDSYMALFEAATDAVRAGLELVEAIPGKGGFSIRMGAATGDVEEIDGDAFGEAVNMASRILHKTPDQEVWLSPGTWICMNQAEIPWESLGRYGLKGITGEVELYRAVPRHRAFLPEPVVEAVRTGRLINLHIGDAIPNLPPRAVLLLTGFTPGTPALKDATDRLPVVDPASVWLNAYNIAPQDRVDWLRTGRGLIVAELGALERSLQETARPTTHGGSDTIILDVNNTALMDLVMAGLALPAVPMSEVVASYTYDLLHDGRWANKADSAVARVEVSPEGVRLTSLSTGVMVAGRRMGPGEAVFLQDGDMIGTSSGVVLFRRCDGNGYAGLLLQDSAGRVSVGAGQQAEIGREPGYPGLQLPDRRGQDNIRWCIGARAARAREGGFTLDRALAGRRQAAIAVSSQGFMLSTLHDRCPTLVWNRQGLQLVTQPRPVVPGDLVVAGTSVVAIREPSN